MAKSMMDAPKKVKKMKAESRVQRRNSTGGAAIIFSEPIPIPNYMRASIGSCHDLCKYGGRRHSDEAVNNASSSATKNPLPRKHKQNAIASTRVVEPKRRTSSLSRTRPRSKKLQKLLETSEKSDQIVEKKIIHVVETDDLNEDGDGNEKMDSTSNESCSRRGEVSRDISWKGELKKEECMGIVAIGKNKVKALVHTFETLITTPDSRASSTST